MPFWPVAVRPAGPLPGTPPVTTHRGAAPPRQRHAHGRGRPGAASPSLLQVAALARLAADRRSQRVRPDGRRARDHPPEREASPGRGQALAPGRAGRRQLRGRRARHDAPAEPGARLRRRRPGQRRTPDRRAEALTPSHRLPYLGDTEDILDIVRPAGASSVIVATTGISLESANRLVRDLTREGIYVELSSAMRDIATRRVTLRPLGRYPVMCVEPVHQHLALGRQARLRHRRRVARAAARLARCCALAALAIRVTSGHGRAVHPDPRRSQRQALHRLQAAHDGARRRVDAARAAGAERGRRSDVQDGRGPPGHQRRPVPAQDLDRRAAAAAQRRQGRHEPGRPPPRAAPRGRAVERRPQASACGSSPA